jgi:hypothetical protein
MSECGETLRTRVTFRRSRLLCVILAAPLIVLGLVSRTDSSPFPGVLGKYPGDALWAWMVFALFAAVWPRSSTSRVAFAALGFSCLVEFAQLYHAPWIDALRGTTLGGLVLGSQFNPLDFAAYAVGVAAGAAADALLHGRSVRARERRPGADDAR